MNPKIAIFAVLLSIAGYASAIENAIVLPEQDITSGVKPIPNNKVPKKEDLVVVGTDVDSNLWFIDMATMRRSSDMTIVKAIQFKVVDSVTYKYCYYMDYLAYRNRLGNRVIMRVIALKILRKVQKGETPDSVGGKEITLRYFPGTKILVSKYHGGEQLVMAGTVHEKICIMLEVFPSKPVEIPKKLRGSYET